MGRFFSYSIKKTHLFFHLDDGHHKKMWACHGMVCVILLKSSQPRHCTLSQVHLYFRILSHPRLRYKRMESMWVYLSCELHYYLMHRVSFFPLCPLLTYPFHMQCSDPFLEVSKGGESCDESSLAAMICFDLACQTDLKCVRLVPCNLQFYFPSTR